MKIKKLLSLLLSLIFAVTAISGCGGIELGDILEEVEYLAGLESEYTDDTTTEPLDDVKAEQTDTSQETDTTDQPEDVTTQQPDITQETETIDEYGTYTSKEDVAETLKEKARKSACFFISIMQFHITQRNVKESKNKINILTLSFPFRHYRI